MSGVTIKPATDRDKGIIAEMMHGYVADLARYTPISPNEQGRYTYPRLDEYWLHPETRFPFLIYADDTLAGFALVSAESRLEDDEAMNMAEFYVLPEKRRTGIGFDAACQILLHFPGRWEVAVLTGNLTALTFWKRVMRAVASGVITEHTFRPKGPIFSFTIE